MHARARHGAFDETLAGMLRKGKEHLSVRFGGSVNRDVQLSSRQHRGKGREQGLSAEDGGADSLERSVGKARRIVDLRSWD